jgi:hypothetical protein
MRHFVRIVVVAVFLVIGLIVTVSPAAGSASGGGLGKGESHRSSPRSFPPAVAGVGSAVSNTPMLAASPAAPVVVQQAELTGSDVAEGDSFGSSLAVCGDTALIAACDKTVGGQIRAGAVYIFTRSGSTWTQQAEISDPDPASNDFFGASIALSGDTALIGAPGKEVGDQSQAGSVYLYTRSGAAWSAQGDLTASDATSGDGFGSSLALYEGTALIGAPSREVNGQFLAGAVYVFTVSGTTWSQQTEIGDPAAATGDAFGTTVALSGDTALIGAPTTSVAGQSRAGIVYVCDGSGSSWSQQAQLVDPDANRDDKFGCALALSGDTALVGALDTTVDNQPLGGAGFVYTDSASGWSQQAILTNPDSDGDDAFGASVALSSDAAVVGAPSASNNNHVDPMPVGAAYLYPGSGASWSAPVKLAEGGGDQYSDDLFGSSAVLEGSTVMVAAEWKTIQNPGGSSQIPLAGAVYVEHRCATPTVSVTGADDAWHASAVNLAVDAIVDPELALADLQYSLDGGSSWLEVPGAGDNRTLPLYNSGTTNLTVRAIDSAHQTDSAAATVKIDYGKPTIGVSGAGASWRKAPVTLTFTPRVGVSGIASVDFQLASSGWTAIEPSSGVFQVVVSTEGANSVRYRVSNNAGTTSAVGSCEVKIDTRRPTPIAKWAANARTGAAARLAYFVSDPRPGSPTATVTIRITTLRGSLVKKLVEKRVAVDKRCTASFDCGLPKGRYRFYVYSTDAAGNAQTKVASNRLTVR